MHTLATHCWHYIDETCFLRHYYCKLLRYVYPSVRQSQPPDIPLSYYPPKIYMTEPKYYLPSPTFVRETGDFDVSDTAWIPNPLPSTETEDFLAFLSLLATRLASPKADTRAMWILMAKRLLFTHRIPNQMTLFPIARLVELAMRIFGPDPLLHHIEAMVFALLTVRSDCTFTADGLAEFVGPCWAVLIVQAMIVQSRQWSRPWRLYLLARVVPRLLSLAEVTAIDLPISGLPQLFEKNVHPNLIPYLTEYIMFAGTYGGLGSPASEETTKCTFFGSLLLLLLRGGGLTEA